MAANEINEVATDTTEVNNPNGVKGFDEDQWNQDQLEKDILSSEYGWVMKLVYSDPELKKLFKLALKEGWNSTQFIAKFKDTQYYQSHTQEWLTVEALRLTKPLAYDEAVQTASASLSRVAQGQGIDLSGVNLTALADEALRTGLMAGDGTLKRPDAVNQWLFTKGGKLTQGQVQGQGVGLTGSAGSVEDKLRGLARANGMSYSDDFYRSASQAVLQGATVADYENYIRQQAAGAYPSLSKQILAGTNVRDLASGYITRMSQILELAPESINLDDPYVSEAMKGIDAEGNPKLMSLYDFEKKLRADPRWENTNNGKNTIMGLASTMMKDWGFLK